MSEAFIPVAAISILFLGLPWLILHYVTKWKQASALTMEDENLLDELHDIARRLDDRMRTIERIIAADHEQPARIGESRTDVRPIGPGSENWSVELRSQPLRKEI
ncbi:MAG: envelope stress response membrane protein PspB [Sandarakinorhabdus sp.]|nr:envelope stress response membrane protein PspB [Sandarakinorhabdus sp.]